MAAPVPDFTPQPVLALGGLCTFLERSEVPIGMSPNCSDVEFRPKTVLSRPGMGLRFTDESAFTGLKSFYGIDRVRRLATLQANGKLAIETPEGQLTQIQHLLTNGAQMKSVWAFNRLWVCFSASAGTSATGMPMVRPLDFPLVYDPVPVGASFPFLIGPVNASAPVAAATAADGAAGLSHPGTHYFFYTYEDKYGFITQQSPVGSWTAAASKKADFSAILPGPLGLFGATAKTRIWMTPAYVTGQGVADFFNNGALTIEDPTATTLTGVDLTDATLQQGTKWSTDNLTLCPPPPAIGVTKFADRLVFWGVYNGVEPRLAARIDGLGSDLVLLGRPVVDFSTLSGWTTDAGSPGITTQATVYASAGTRTGKYLSLDATSHIHKDFTNLQTSSSQDNQYWLKSGQRYGFLVRMSSASNAATSVTISMIAQSATTTLATATLTPPIPNPNLQTQWSVYEVNGVADVPAGETTIRFDLATASGIGVKIDWIRPYLQANKFDGSTVWIGDNLIPMNFDLQKSPLPVARGDWQETRCCFEQTGNLYIVKEHSTWVTGDNGQDPSGWNIDNVSFEMGTPSIHGVALGPEFAIIAGREGVYRFDSGGINKISQEIETTWKGVDWKQGHLLHVTLDPYLKLIRVAVPLKTGPAGTCNIILKCDYTEGWNDASISDQEYAQASGSRKWEIDNVATLCGEMAEKDDGSRNFLAGGASTSSNNTAADFALPQPAATTAATAFNQVGTRAVTATGSQAQPMGPYVRTGFSFAAKWSFPFSSGTARYRATDGVVCATGAYFTVAFWAFSTTAGVSVPATIRDPLGLADVPIVITPAYQRFVATFGPNPNAVNTRTVTDGAMATSANILTSATAAFTLADVGKSISVTVAGGSGTATLYTIISGFTNATTVTLAVANQNAFGISGQTVVISVQEALDLDFGTLTTPILVTLDSPQIQTGQFDHGWTGPLAYNAATNKTGTGLASGFLAEPIVYAPGSDPPWKTADWNGVITPTYETAPLAPTQFGQNYFTTLVARMRGHGTVQASYVRPDGTTRALNAGQGAILSTNPMNDVEMGGTEQGTFVGMRFSVQDVNGWFALKRLAILTKLLESNAFRGKT